MRPPPNHGMNSAEESLRFSQPVIPPLCASPILREQEVLAILEIQMKEFRIGGGIFMMKCNVLLSVILWLLLALSGTSWSYSAEVGV